MNEQDAPDRYVGSVVVYKGRSRFLRRDENGFYVDSARSTLNGYLPTGETRRLMPGDDIVIHGKRTMHLTIP